MSAVVFSRITNARSSSVPAAAQRELETRARGRAKDVGLGVERAMGAVEAREQAGLLKQVTEQRNALQAGGQRYVEAAQAAISAGSGGKETLTKTAKKLSPRDARGLLVCVPRSERLPDR